MRLVLLMVGSALCGVLILPSRLVAGPMTTDPNRFYGFQWETSLSDVQNLVKVESGQHLQAYELKRGAPKLGETMVTSYGS